MTGLPYLIRVVVPTLELRRPKVPVRGIDLAGNVEAVGSTVTRFQPGDEVFGWTDGGSYAEYACAPRTTSPETIEPLRCAGGGRAHLRLRRPPGAAGCGLASPSTPTSSRPAPSPTGSPPARPAAASEPARGSAAGRLWPPPAGASTTEALAGLILGQ